MKTMRIVNVGVGGQGNLLASNLIGQAALAAGKHVVVSEIHGMAQRGGVVESAVILGPAKSPVVSSAEADVLVSFEPSETARILGKANKNTVVVTNIRPLPPFTATLGQAPYPDPTSVVDYIRPRVGRVVTVDAQDLAEKAGNPLALNMVMLGALFAAVDMPVPVKAMKDTIRAKTKAKFADSNIKAFDLGYEAAKA